MIDAVAIDNPKQGDKAQFRNHSCVWTACPTCGKSRWVRTKRGGLPEYLLCVSCSTATPERRLKSSQRETGRKHSPERIEKNRQGHLGQIISLETREKISRTSKGRVHSATAKQKLSVAHKKLWSNPEFREKTLKMLASSSTPEGRKRGAEKLREYWRLKRKTYKPRALYRPTIKELNATDIGNIGDIVLTKPASKAVKALCPVCGIARWVRLVYGKPRSTVCRRCCLPKTKERMTEALKCIWANRDDPRVKHRIQNMALGQHRHPNKPETVVQNILDKLYPSEWKFVGDGQVLINHLNPDFINTNGKKLIIEVFGDYWHGDTFTRKNRRAGEKERIKVFSGYGYRTLILWEHEIQDQVAITARIRSFVK